MKEDGQESNGELILVDLINLVMGADINQDYFLFGDHHFKADPIADID